MFPLLRHRLTCRKSVVSSAIVALKDCSDEPRIASAAAQILVNLSEMYVSMSNYPLLTSDSHGPSDQYCDQIVEEANIANYVSYLSAEVSPE